MFMVNACDHLKFQSVRLINKYTLAVGAIWAESPAAAARYTTVIFAISGR